MTFNIEPKTRLPWTELPCYFDNQCQAYEPKDAEYMLHAANAYPKLIELLKELGGNIYAPEKR